MKKIYLIIPVVLTLGLAYTWEKSNSYLHEEKAVQFIQNNLQVIASCNEQELKHLLTFELQEEFFETIDQACKIKYSSVGKLLTYEKPEFIRVKYPPSVKSDVSASHIEFQTVGHFERGDVLITLVLTEEIDSFQIKSIHLSEIADSK